MRLAASSGTCPAYKMQLSWRGRWGPPATPPPGPAPTVPPPPLPLTSAGKPRAAAGDVEAAAAAVPGESGHLEDCCACAAGAPAPVMVLIGGSVGEGPRVSAGDVEGDDAGQRPDDVAAVEAPVALTLTISGIAGTPRVETVSTTPRLCSHFPPCGSGAKNLRCFSGRSQCSGDWPLNISTRCVANPCLTRSYHAGAAPHRRRLHLYMSSGSPDTTAPVRQPVQ
jgi:hypothetical protein